MNKKRITLKINGVEKTLEVEPNKTLLWLIREELKLKGTKKACEHGECGLCTVLMDGEPVKSCLVLAVEADGREITTIEGITRDGELTVIQRSFMEHGAAQCGYCTPAFIIVAHWFLSRNPNPTREELIKVLNSLLCRCTGYRPIIEAIMDAAEKLRK